MRQNATKVLNLCRDIGIVAHKTQFFTLPEGVDRKHHLCLFRKNIIGTNDDQLIGIVEIARYAHHRALAHG